MTFVPPHVSRSRYIINRCWDGDIDVVADPPRPLPVWVWAANYVWQTAGYVRAQFQEC